MHAATVRLRSVSPYSQSRFHNTPALDKEGKDDYEKRTWQNRLHVSEDGNVFIPPMAFKNCLSECAKFISIQIPGKGKATYTKHFEAGVMVMEPSALSIKAQDVPGEWYHVPSDGQRGGSKRVLKCFPAIASWETNVKFYVLDDTITKDVFEKHLSQAGQFIGVGRFRPRNNGFYGRFEIVNLKWEEVS